MKAISTLSICALLAAAAVGTAPHASQAVPWKAFRSETYRYTVRYPSTWYLFVTALRPKLDYLDILSFPPSETWKGVVIRKGGAEITVASAPQRVRTVEQWAKWSTKFDTQVRQRPVPISTHEPSGCKSLTEVVSLSQVGPATYQVFTDYYCPTAHGLYGVTLVSWKGDAKQKEFQRVALKIALSLRSW